MYKVKIMSVYKYLGLLLIPYTSWSSGKCKLAAQAKKAIFPNKSYKRKFWIFSINRILLRFWYNGHTNSYIRSRDIGDWTFWYYRKCTSTILSWILRCKLYKTCLFDTIWMWNINFMCYIWAAPWVNQW